MATLTKTIPAYLYQEYRDPNQDDQVHIDELFALVDAYNTLAQEFVDWFNALNLPIYTSAPVKGLLLDWVAEGLYGMMRPVLGTVVTRYRGSYNTWMMNQLTMNGRQIQRTTTIIDTTDDIFRRLLTWHLWRGDGPYFTTRWLKRRVARFLTGADGGPGATDSTYRISVSFGLDGQVNITLLIRLTRVVRSMVYNGFMMNQMPMNWSVLAHTSLGTQYPLAQAFKDAVDEGVLEVPFTNEWVVTVQS